ncbi:MAG: RNA polymerase sigma-54 factor [Deltaproteobacteria bacterium]|nr:MAG: RNA polymerase sigma-54 factor [Deltaproteobacteria bacterium]
MVELKQVLSLKQTLQLVMTPQLQQAIKLLQLSRLELSETINAEMLENPVLEEEVEPDAADLPAASAEDRLRQAAERVKERTEKIERVEEVKGADGLNDIDWEQVLENYSSYTPAVGPRDRSSDDQPPMEAMTSKTPTLVDHLMWQLRLAPLSEREMDIGAQIIMNLNSDGYFVADDEDRLAGREAIQVVAQSSETSPEEVERVLQVIQTFDPVGVAARNLRESLLIQARHLGIENGLVYAIIESHLGLLERKNFAAIARELKVSKDQVVQAVQMISRLEPRPGRMYTDERPYYITPDIYVYKLGDEYVIVLNEDGLPKLRISSYYQKALRAATNGDETQNYIQDKLRSAMWLIRSIHQRQRTIYRVTESIVKFQREFFDKGVAYLKPMVLKDVADDLGLHESTVSRVTTNKYVHTPQGIFELKYFFNTGLRRSDGGEDVASESVKEMIRHIVAGEDPQKPLSDREIVDLLKEKGIHIARRTVAKYRELLGILPSSKRKKMF